eukprot:NODE_21545_length_748_cov_2.716586.p4 GENE.NODE_21545_length_748_cov_2.716586~~NODE_21545_length_748_cov_2.716586.p4  ORF type:complete len:50 (+),score=2.43 NODE_21545_length_748_cov_2.716586:361-510(+)
MRTLSGVVLRGGGANVRGAHRWAQSPLWARGLFSCRGVTGGVLRHSSHS